MLPDVTLPDSVQALIVVIAFFTPGFIAGKVFELCFPRGKVTERVRLLEYVTLSSVNYAFWSWLTMVRWQWWQGHPVVVGVVVVGVLFLSPVVLGGSLDHLATKFAEANSNASSYASWRQTNTSLNLGRIPKRILRQPDFVEQVIEIYDDQCLAKDTEAT